MPIKYSNFVSSYTKVSECPKPDRPEYAFIGRSNVGKSSLINYLTDRKALAKVSGTPGKTQLINYFSIDNIWYLVDLPGYGYAKVSKTSRQKWLKMIKGYLSKRESLVTTFVLIDCRIPPQPIDIEFINWLGEMLIPFSIIYTKSEKLKPEELKTNLEEIENALLEYWDALPPRFVTSATKKIGGEDVLNYIGELNATIIKS